MPEPHPKAKLVERSQEPRRIPKCFIFSERVNISWAPSDKDSWKDEERRKKDRNIEMYGCRK